MGDGVPGLGTIAPLNTPEGSEFVQRLINIVKPDGVMVTT